MTDVPSRLLSVHPATHQNMLTTSSLRHSERQRVRSWARACLPQRTCWRSTTFSKPTRADRSRSPSPNRMCRCAVIRCGCAGASVRSTTAVTSLSSDPGEHCLRRASASQHSSHPAPSFASVQDCFAAASRITSHLPDDAQTNKTLHPLFGYAHRTAGEVLFQCVPMTLNMLGHDAHRWRSMTGRWLTFTADLDIKPERDGLKEVAGWPTAAATACGAER